MLMALLGPQRLIPLLSSARLATIGVLSWKTAPGHLG
jgi:hypothetical protein